MTEHTKDLWGFSLATVMVGTGIVLAFISFFTLSLIHSSILFYIGIGVSFFGALMGISMKFTGLEGQFIAKMNEVETIIDEKINKKINNNKTIDDIDDQL